MARVIATILIVLIIDCGGQQFEMPTAKTKPPFKTYPTKTTRHFSPNFGFEQYWPGGDWKYLEHMQDPKKKRGPTTTLPPSPKVCGADCPAGYAKINEVCVVPTEPDNPKLMNRYQTMSYCEYLQVSNPSCNLKSWTSVQFIFVHIGPCVTNYVGYYHRGTPRFDGTTYPTMTTQTGHDWTFISYTPDTFEMDPSKRASKFIDELQKRFPAVGERQAFQNYP